MNLRESTCHVITVQEKAALDAAIALYHADIEWTEVAGSDGDDWPDRMSAVQAKHDDVYAAFEQAVAKIVGAA